MTDARPYPKARQLARGVPRYRRRVASPKQWQAIVAAKQGPCRVCTQPQFNGYDWSSIEFHHIVSRQDGGDDVPENIVPVHRLCHQYLTERDPLACARLLAHLSDDEYAYMIARGGEDYPERAYGVRCGR